MDDVEVKFTRAQVLTAQIVDAFARPASSHTSDPADPFYAKGKKSESIFTAMVDLLRKKEGPVGDLCSYAWDVFHNKHVQLALGPDVPSVHVAIVGSSPAEARSLVFVPHEWPSMVEREPLMQLGAVVYTASQVVDFYNGMFPPREPSARIKGRAASYEAEYLRMLDASRLNEYQLEVLRENPEGFHQRFSYHRRPVVGKE